MDTDRKKEEANLDKLGFCPDRIFISVLIISCTSPEMGDFKEI